LTSRSGAPDVGTLLGALDVVVEDDAFVVLRGAGGQALFVCDVDNVVGDDFRLGLSGGSSPKSMPRA
jgi:hypothetical protein